MKGTNLSRKQVRKFRKLNDRYRRKAKREASDRAARAFGRTTGQTIELVGGLAGAAWLTIAGATVVALKAARFAADSIGTAVGSAALFAELVVKGLLANEDDLDY